jgi:molybdate transport system substrate-binding protein
MHMNRRGLILGLMLAVGLPATAPSTAQAQDQAPLVVFAAASLKNALDSASASYTAASGVKVSISYAGSPALAKQIEQAAPADIFVSADLDWMDYLAGKDLILAGTRTSLLANRLVLIAPASSSVMLNIREGFALAQALGDGRLATADVSSVPAGKYAKAALSALKVWDAVEPKLAQMENVRAALALVAQGEAPLGVVYASDAAAEPKVKIIGEFPQSSHPPIIYPAAVLKSSAKPDAARAFIAYLRSPEGRPAFLKQGFTVLD